MIGVDIEAKSPSATAKRNFMISPKGNAGNAEKINSAAVLRFRAKAGQEKSVRT
jgi:hypothetical protein